MASPPVFFIRTSFTRAGNLIVIGPGALGTLFATRLFLAGIPVSLFDHRPDRASILQSTGLRIQVDQEEFRAQVPMTSDPIAIASADVILLCVKSRDVASILQGIAPFVSPDGPLIIAFQNGIAHHEIFRELSRAPWAIGVTALGATLLRSGFARFGGQGMTRIGFLIHNPAPVATARLQQTVEAFTAAGLPCQASEDIRTHSWNKFLVNLGINGLTAIFDCPNGALLDIPEAAVRQERAVREAILVAQASGIAIHPDPVALCREVCAKTAANISSLLQDVRRGRKTEIDALNGALVQLARKAGLPAPENERIWSEVKGLEKKLES